MKLTKKQIKHMLLEGHATTKAFEQAAERYHAFGPGDVAKKAIEMAAQEAIDSGYTAWPDPTDYIEKAKEALYQRAPSPGPMTHPDYPDMTMPMESLTKSNIKRMLMEGPNDPPAQRSLKDILGPYGATAAEKERGAKHRAKLRKLGPPPVKPPAAKKNNAPAAKKTKKYW